MAIYSLERAGSLLLTKAAVAGPAGVRVVKLLVDTGSVYTVLPVEVLESVACSPAESRDRVRIVTGSGYLVLPQVRLTWLQCLGRKLDDMVVVAHTLPMGSFVDGLLGIDFLNAVNARISVAEGIIELDS
jgi:predicted aspartyl protease